MTSKTVKKRYRDQNRPARPRSPKQGLHAGQDKRGPARPCRNAPKPPPKGFFIWGRHAVLAALANPERRVATLYVTADATGDLQQAIATLPSTRSIDLPPLTMTERERLDGITWLAVLIARWDAYKMDLAHTLKGCAHWRGRLVALDTGIRRLHRHRCSRPAPLPVRPILYFQGPRAFLMASPPLGLSPPPWNRCWNCFWRQRWRRWSRGLGCTSLRRRIPCEPAGRGRNGRQGTRKSR